AFQLVSICEVQELLYTTLSPLSTPFFTFFIYFLILVKITAEQSKFGSPVELNQLYLLYYKPPKHF
ncbi:MAG: hypothetical protein Q4A46_09220, partial [Clostridia bacterium]|nr:hypothetical protein [Clostridia bacterium]